MKWEVAEPLLEEMWACVQIMPDSSKPHVVRNLIEQDIEEIATRIKLRAEVWKLHVDFLKAVAPSISSESKATVRKKICRILKCFINNRNFAIKKNGNFA